MHLDCGQGETRSPDIPPPPDGCGVLIKQEKRPGGWGDAAALPAEPEPSRGDPLPAPPEPNLSPRP